jgi:hypothetical protein
MELQIISFQTKLMIKCMFLKADQLMDNLLKRMLINTFKINQRLQFQLTSEEKIE